MTQPHPAAPTTATQSPARSGTPAENADTTVGALLAGAVEALGGAQRPGQVAMAEAVAAAMATGEHLLVQAGTGTGKSLAYLVPAFEHARSGGGPVVVATATLALQAQLVGRDLPLLADAIEASRGRRPTYAIYKGRSNYACLHRVRDGVPDDQGELVDVEPSGPLGREVLALREWAREQAEREASGDRDEAPTHREQAWRQVAVSARECLGADRCPYAGECFAERAKQTAMSAEVVVTNHALLAIDALENFQVLPDYDVVVIDEAHELASRVTATASAELAPGIVERAARRARSYCTEGEAGTLEDAGEALRTALAEAEHGRVDTLPYALADAVASVRDTARSVWSAMPAESKDPDDEAGARQARVAVDQVREVAERIAAMSPYDVVWVAERERGGPELRVAPLSVSGLLRERLFAERTCVLTSATLEVGGGFDASAKLVGLRPVDRVGASPADTSQAGSPAAAPAGSAAPPRLPAAAQSDGSQEAEVLMASDQVEPLAWHGLDVGSPFDYARQSILYVARDLPTPGRDGISRAALEQLAELVTAAGGRTLGLFSSRRAAETAAEFVRERVTHEVWCQGDTQLSELHRRFVDAERSSLFGTLSLWQGLDVPGQTCQLVVIDRIPFPRPDDPLMSARQRAVDDAGGNGFMAVAATHAGLLLAQGVGRLIRRSTDRGVVAVLDPRLATRRYAGFLRASLPAMWDTGDLQVVTGALRRLDATAGGSR